MFRLLEFCMNENDLLHIGYRLSLYRYYHIPTVERSRAMHHEHKQDLNRMSPSRTVVRGKGGHFKHAKVQLRRSRRPALHSTPSLTTFLGVENRVVADDAVVRVQMVSRFRILINTQVHSASPESRAKENTVKTTETQISTAKSPAQIPTTL